MDDIKKTQLWEEYAKTKSDQVREQLILEYVSLVKLVAGRLNMYLGYTVEYDDLVSYGVFGLIDAIDKFDYGKNVKFETYASLRIRGAILDQIRKMDWIPRSLRQKQRRIDQAMSKIETETGKPATDEQIVQELGITLDELNNWQGQAKMSNMVSLDEFTEEGTETTKMEAVGNARFEKPEDAVEREELKKMIVEALDTLTEKEREVVVLYYYEDMTLKEISLVLEVSESRVSQLHTKALNKMKLKLGDYMGVLG